MRTLVAVVDDDPLMLRAVERLLEAHGVEVRAFDSAEAFLEGDAAREATCLVLDIGLGGMSGVELGRRLEKDGYQLPIIFITGFENAGEYEEAMAIGCVAFLRKPFVAAQLIGAIDKAMCQ
jgi:FixJ family two-component response regulator